MLINTILKGLLNDAWLFQITPGCDDGAQQRGWACQSGKEDDGGGNYNKTTTLFLQNNFWLQYPPLALLLQFSAWTMLLVLACLGGYVLPPDGSWTLRRIRQYNGWLNHDGRVKYIDAASTTTSTTVTSSTVDSCSITASSFDSSATDSTAIGQ